MPLRFLSITLSILLATLGRGVASVGDDPFSDWPEGAAPAEVGERIAKEFMGRKFRYETNRRKAHLGVIYPEICVWYGALTLAEESGKDELGKQLIAKFMPYVDGDKSRRINRSRHVDYRMLGSLPLQIHMMNGDPSCLRMGLGFADAQWEQTGDDGITREARYWIDDMYMITILQMQAYRATDEPKYLDHAADAMLAYLDRLQQPNGLFYHGPDSKFYWGRGNGWVAVGMAELLRSMPESHPKREAILVAYRSMMTAVLKLQGDEGLWRQLLDDPDSWVETSASGMFTFAFVTGVKNGWLEASSFGPAARKAWLALVGCLDDDARIRDVCIGTDKGFSREFYLRRPRATGDLHGQAPMLWTASALLREPTQDS